MAWGGPLYQGRLLADGEDCLVSPCRYRGQEPTGELAPARPCVLLILCACLPHSRLCPHATDRRGEAIPPTSGKMERVVSVGDKIQDAVKASHCAPDSFCNQDDSKESLP